MQYLTKNIENRYGSNNTFYSFDISGLEQDDLGFFTYNIIINGYLSQEAFESGKSIIDRYRQMRIYDEVNEFYKISEASLFTGEGAKSKEKLRNIIIQKIVSSIIINGNEKNTFISENGNEVNFINSEIVEL